MKLLITSLILSLIASFYAFAQNNQAPAAPAPEAMSQGQATASEDSAAPAHETKHKKSKKAAHKAKKKHHKKKHHAPAN